jgi:hypothetical protein
MFVPIRRRRENLTTFGGESAVVNIARYWPRYHRRLYQKAEPSRLVFGTGLLVPGGLLMAGNPNIMRLLPVFSDFVILNSLAALVFAKIVGFVLLTVGYRLVRTSKRIGAFSANERLQRDPRPRILYIRAFVNDNRLTSQADPGEKFFNPLAWSQEVRFEEALANGLAPIGALCAIGKPGEELPLLGAVRHYPKGPWKDAFKQMHNECALVAVQAGHGDGLTYELIEALKLASFKPILLCFPLARPGDPPPEKEYAAFKALLEQQGVRPVLPPRLGRGYFIWFSTPKEGMVLTPREVSFEARRMNEVFPGFTAVRQKFDDIVPGMTWHAVHRSERTMIIAFSILAGFATALSMLVTVLLWL